MKFWNCPERKVYEFVIEREKAMLYKANKCSILTAGSWYFKSVLTLRLADLVFSTDVCYIPFPFQTF